MSGPWAVTAVIAHVAIRVRMLMSCIVDDGVDFVWSLQNMVSERQKGVGF